MTSRLKRFFAILGPGLVTGAADDDPSGVATYAQAGAVYSNGLLWTVPVCLPLMMAVQEICDRMTLASGDSLGALIRRRFSHGVRTVIGVLLTALILANTLNLSADLMAIGQGMKLLGAGPAPVWSVIAGVGIGVAVVAGSFEWIVRVFKWLCMILFVYVAVLFVSHVDWADVAAGLVGARIDVGSAAYWGLCVAVLGTTISPYMFFWQTAQRVEQLRRDGNGDAKTVQDRSPAGARRRLRTGRADVFTGMAFSMLIMFAIIAASAATLGAHHTRVTTAADAAKALEPIAGTYAGVLFAVGFIGSGMLAVPVLAAAGAAGMAGLVDKPWGLDKDPRRARMFYILLAVGLIAGTVLAVFVANPIQVLVLAALVNGIAAGPFLVVIMLISSHSAIMGRFRNGRLAQTLGWIITALMCVAGVYGVWYTVAGG